jgi:asparagine synthase (glutamine-hydrolysing)
LSAIFGILRFDGGEANARDLERMAGRLRHRGPDGSDFVVAGAVGLGQCLMRVNRGDPSGPQPLHDREAALTLVADLRLDNREELAAAFGLRGGSAELSDSALLMRAYKTWGEGCVEHLLGDFAFAIWDGAATKLFLARDHMGQRYVHYHKGRDFFAFATDVKALWAVPEVPRALLDTAIGRMLSFDLSPSGGATLFDGIAGLDGATALTLGADGSLATRRYWEPHADPAHEGRDEAYYIEAYRRVLGEAVACRIRRALRPPGILFSGGYDSAAIAGLAGPVLAESGRKLVAAASVMAADYHGTIRHARPWVEMCARDMPHLDVRYVTREGKTMLTGLEQAFLESESPAGSYHFATGELLSAVAGAGAQVLLDGHGGDYTLNPRGAASLARFLATFQLRRFFSELRGHRRLSGHSWWRTFRGDILAPLLPPSVAALWRRLWRKSAPIWRDLPINPAFAQRLISEGAIDVKNLVAAPQAKLDMRARLVFALRRVAGAATPGTAAKAAQHGLELTRPFHDKRVVELALAIPQDLYVKNGRNRYLACVALKDLYPSEFQSRWRRNDDEIPDFQRMAKSIEPQLLSEIARMERSEVLRGYVDFDKIRQLLAARGTDDHNSGWEQETQRALHGFVIVRYIEWFRRANQ